MSDLIDRQAAIDVLEIFIKDCNPEHFVGHPNFIEYMDSVGIQSFGNWQYANGFNMGLTAAEVAIKELLSAQTEPLTDKEQRIFLAAMSREEEVCKEVDADMTREAYEDSLVRTCHEIIRKVKGALWT